MNRARQEQITTEIMEIVGGAEALGPAATAISTSVSISGGYAALTASHTGH